MILLSIYLKINAIKINKIFKNNSMSEIAGLGGASLWN